MAVFDRHRSDFSRHSGARFSANPESRAIYLGIPGSSLRDAPE
jgi:hypothetical protein